MITKRKKLLVSLLLMIIVVSGLLVCVSGAGLPLLAKDAIILAFGDSLNFGTGGSHLRKVVRRFWNVWLGGGW